MSTTARFPLGKIIVADYNQSIPVGKPETQCLKHHRFATQENPLLHIELEQHHIAVGDDVFFSFHAVQAFGARGGDRTALY